MKKPNLLYYTPLNFDSQNISKLSRYFNVIEVEEFNTDIDKILYNIEVSCAPLHIYFDKFRMDKSPHLKAIISNTTGTSHIDINAAKNRKIEVFSLANEQEFLSNITSTAEHAFGLILCLLRKIPWSFNSVLNNEWNRFNFGSPSMLSRLSIGIIGLGRLGSMMATYATAFKMNVNYFDPFNNEKYPNFNRFDSVLSLVKVSDIVSLHIPSNEKTISLIDEGVFNSFRDNSIIINTSRGEIIDESALLNALKNGKLAGAALDVLSGEFSPNFRPQDNNLVKYAKSNNNLLLTPHIGGSTEDAWKETQLRVIDKVIEFFDGK